MSRLSLLFILLLLAVLIHSFKAQATCTIPGEVEAFVPIKITGLTAGAYPIEITINSSRYAAFEASDLSNIEFFGADGQPFPSWLQDNNSNTATTTHYWILSSSVPAGGTIYMGLANSSVSLLNGVNAGEAPQLSPSYGQYDNGGSIFTSGYENFAGTGSLPSGWSASVAYETYNGQMVNGNPEPPWAPIPESASLDNELHINASAVEGCNVGGVWSSCYNFYVGAYTSLPGLGNTSSGELHIETGVSVLNDTSGNNGGDYVTFVGYSNSSGYYGYSASCWGWGNSKSAIKECKGGNDCNETFAGGDPGTSSPDHNLKSWTNSAVSNTYYTTEFDWTASGNLSASCSSSSGSYTVTNKDYQLKNANMVYIAVKAPENGAADYSVKWMRALPNTPPSTAIPDNVIQLPLLNLDPNSPITPNTTETITATCRPAPSPDTCEILVNGAVVETGTGSATYTSTFPVGTYTITALDVQAMQEADACAQTTKILVVQPKPKTCHNFCSLQGPEVQMNDPIYCQINCSVTTSYASGTGFGGGGGGGGGAGAGGSFTYSPVSQVSDYNKKNVPGFLTCPSQPPTNPTSNTLFDTSFKVANPLAETFIGGDSCNPHPDSLTTQYTFFADVNLNQEGPSYPLLANTVFDTIVFQDGVLLGAENIAYSPMVDSALSNMFSNSSYVFQRQPDYVQHGIWTWFAEFPDFSKAVINPNSVSFTNNSLLYTPVAYPGCEYKYNYSTNITLKSIANYVMPYNEVIMLNARTNNFTFKNFPTGILPFLTYDYSLPAPTSQLTTTQPMEMSYDIFGPWNYYTPANNIDLFPINTASEFYVAYNGTLTFVDANSILSSTNTLPFVDRWNNLTARMAALGATDFSSIEKIALQGSGLQLPSIADIIAITALPNDYIFVLNYSPFVKDYYITVLRIYPHGYFPVNKLTPFFANSLGIWNRTWLKYWSSVFSAQNESTYVVNKFSLKQLGLYGFNPIGMSIDSGGDVFLLGPSELARINNAINGPTLAYFAGAPTDTSEIAVSQTGQLVFLAGQNDGGYVYVVSGANFSPLNKIDLTYAKTLPGVSSIPSASGVSATISVLNVLYWLSHGGLFNQTNLVSSSAIGLDSPSYHHPLGLAELNGYLYVLDNWGGSLGVSASGGWIPCGAPGISCTYSGTFFDILTLRVLNSTGYDAPINPTFFNDMFSTGKCALSSSDGTTINQGACGPEAGSSGGPPSQMSCSPSASCTLVTSQCSYVSGRYFASGYSYSCLSSSGSSNYVALSMPYYYPTNAYPPYGWILSANLGSGSIGGQPFGGTFYDPSGASSIFSACNSNQSSSAYKCDITPSKHCSSNGCYHGLFQPEGPFITGLSMSKTCGTWGNGCTPTDLRASDEGQGSSQFAPSFSGLGFSQSYNGTVSIMFSNATQSVQAPQFGTDLFYQNVNPNPYPYLLVAIYDAENYTKLFDGNAPSACYSSSLAVNCSQLNATNYMGSPVYTMYDPFKYLEDLGSPQLATFEGTFGSSFTGGTGGPPAASQECGSEIANSGVAGSACTKPFNATAAYNWANAKISSPITGLSSMPGETISSLESGYAAVPYTFNYMINQTWTNFVFVKNVAPASPTAIDCPSAVNTQCLPTGDVCASDCSMIVHTGCACGGLNCCIPLATCNQCLPSGAYACPSSCSGISNSACDSGTSCGSLSSSAAIIDCPSAVNTQCLPTGDVCASDCSMIVHTGCACGGLNCCIPLATCNQCLPSGAYACPSSCSVISNSACASGASCGSLSATTSTTLTSSSSSTSTIPSSNGQGTCASAGGTCDTTLQCLVLCAQINLYPVCSPSYECSGSTSCCCQNCAPSQSTISTTATSTTVTSTTATSTLPATTLPANFHYCSCGSCVTSNCACPSSCPEEEDPGCMPANNQRLSCTGTPTAPPATSTSTTSSTSVTTCPQTLPNIHTTNAFTDYSFYTNHPIYHSNHLNTTIEGGDTYLQTLVTKYYIPYLSDYNTTLPPEILYLIKTSRLFGDLFINITTNNLHDGGNGDQYVSNATHRLNYYISTISQGAYASYQEVHSTQVLDYGITAASEILKAPQYLSEDTFFSYADIQYPSVVNLFNFYKTTVYLANATIILHKPLCACGSCFTPQFCLGCPASCPAQADAGCQNLGFADKCAIPSLT